MLLQQQQQEEEKEEEEVVGVVEGLTRAVIPPLQIQHPRRPVIPLHRPQRGPRRTWC